MQDNFEDAYTDLQSSIIALCIEITDESTDYICAFISDLCIDNYYFNVFFIVGKKVYNFSDLPVNYNIKKQFFELIKEDINSIYRLFNTFNRDIPEEIMMIYDNSNKSFSFEHGYESDLNDQAEIKFGLWKNSITKRIN